MSLIFPFPFIGTRYPTRTGARIKQIQFDYERRAHGGGGNVVKRPKITADANPYVDPVTITISHNRSDAVLHYTTDGSDPTVASAVYPGAFQLTGATQWVVKAIAVYGTKVSRVSSLLVTRSVVAEPSITPAGGVFYESQAVTLACATAGASMRYTTNGTTPTHLVGTVYAAPFNIDADLTVKAIAYKTGYTNSPVNTKTFAQEAYDIYVGSNVAASILEADLFAMTGSNGSSPDGTYNFGPFAPEEYLYIAWKATLNRNPVAGSGFQNDFGSLLGDMADTAPYDNEINGWYYDEIVAAGSTFRVFRTKNTIALAMPIYVETEAEAPLP